MIFFQDKNIALLNCDVLDGLKTLPDQSVQCVVTSPPYYGLRDYGHAGQIGAEKTPDLYVAKMVEVFREVKRVLKNDGTLWLNLGDSYAGKGIGSDHGKAVFNDETCGKKSKLPIGLKNKDLIGIPWRVAFALQADGWYLRQDIIWNKPNTMPESVTDRCTKSHEYIFLLSKSAKYYFDAEAIKEPTTTKNDLQRDRTESRLNNTPGRRKITGLTINSYEKRNKRSVWCVNTHLYKDAHFAVFPNKLIKPCILAGSKSGDTVLDPFWGSGTTGEAATVHGRKVIGIELNREYCELSLDRFKQATMGIG